MKKVFTKEFIMKNRGCYSIDKANTLSFINKKVITIYDIAYSEISVGDLLWFLYANCSVCITLKKFLERRDMDLGDSNYNRNVLIDFIDKNI